MWKVFEGHFYKNCEKIRQRPSYPCDIKTSDCKFLVIEVSLTSWKGLTWSFVKIHQSEIAKYTFLEERRKSKTVWNIHGWRQYF